MQKKIGLSGLLFTGIGSIVGSGWLMSAYIITSLSGPAAILSWIVSAVIITIVAFNFIEVCGYLPVHSGGFGHYIDYSYGPGLSFMVELIFILCWIGIIPAEATATVQYFSFMLGHAKTLIVSLDGNLTTLGTLITSGVCIIFFIINYISLAILMKFIKYITIIKIIVPIVVAVVLIYVAHHFANFGIQAHHFAPYGYNGVLKAITAGGILFAFNGFQTSVTFADVAINPKRNIPLAIILSLIFCTVIYIMLQISYIISMPHDMMLSGWHNIRLEAPFLDLSSHYGLHTMTAIVSVIAFIAPFGAGLIYFASSAKIMYSFEKYLPSIIYAKHRGMPFGSLLIVLLGTLCFIWLLPDWEDMVSVVCVGLTVLFAMVCILNGSLNRYALESKKKHGLQIKWGGLLPLLGFIASSLMYFWSMWPLTFKCFILLIVVTIIFLLLYSKQHGLKQAICEIWRFTWVILHIGALTILSYIQHCNLISSLNSAIISVIVAIIFYTLGIRSSKMTTKLKNYIVHLG